MPVATEKAEDLMALNLRNVPRKLVAEIRKLAIDERRTVVAITIEALEDVLRRKNRKA